MREGVYYRHKETCVTFNKEPTLTDQSQANDTDINVIVKRYTMHGQLPQTKQTARYGDFTEIPDNLRDLLELGKKAEQHRQALPDELKKLSTAQLLSLRPEQLKAIITPPATTPTDNKEETK